MAKKDTSFQEKMKELAKKTDLKYDGGDDTRLFVENSLTVFVLPMSEENYKKMEEDLASYSIKGEGYSVYGWNDVSGFNYWKNSGESGDANYIQVTVDIENPDVVDPVKIKKDVQSATNHFEQYENGDEVSEFWSDKEAYLKKIEKKKSKKR